MVFSLIFLTHTALLLGQGQLNGYGVNTQAERTKCQNELFRSARIVQEADASFTSADGDKLENRIRQVCYHNRISSTQEALEITLD